MTKQSLEDCLSRTLGLSSLGALAPEMNTVVHKELRSLVGELPLDRLLRQFLLGLDERLLVIGNPHGSQADEVQHNLHMMRYSAERLGFERLAQYATQVSEVQLSFSDIAIDSSGDQMPGLVLKPSNAFLSGLQRL